VSARPSAVVPEYLPQAALARLAEVCEVVYDPDLYADRPRLMDAMSDANAILIRNRTIIDEDLLTAAPRLRVVGRLGVGLDNIDMEACDAAGVAVYPALGANSVAVAEYVMGALLVLARPVFGQTDAMIRGEWPRQGHAFGWELAGKTIGLIGLGSIARQVAVRAAAFEMRVVAHDPFVPADDTAWYGVERLGLADLLAESDVVSIHVPRTAETIGLIDDEALAAMKPGALLINTARGGIVDESALIEALQGEYRRSRRSDRPVDGRGRARGAGRAGASSPVKVRRAIRNRSQRWLRAHHARSLRGADGPRTRRATASAALRR
jgi:(S)-sulfolactate dehydrogenase